MISDDKTIRNLLEMVLGASDFFLLVETVISLVTFQTWYVLNPFLLWLILDYPI
ncbi:hypothetical protein [Streptococcus catagoni]|uniref:hypothetical protein n=1 Tax=Streptococcus catagoni TaxID=2654874 RepID=UPI00140C975D|nr:hypothetical protein [Streptococcus catagoni]